MLKAQKHREPAPPRNPRGRPPLPWSTELVHVRVPDFLIDRLDALPGGSRSDKLRHVLCKVFELNEEELWAWREDKD